MQPFHARVTQSLGTTDPVECAREPIHIPGAIQPHGVLLVLDQSLTICQASSNSGTLLGRAPESLLGTKVLDLIVVGMKEAVEQLIRAAASTFVNPFRVPVALEDEIRVFDGIAHVVEGIGTILELESDPQKESADNRFEGLDNYLQIVQRSLARISSATGVVEIAEVMAEEVKAFTGFDRVMVYRFAPDFHGHVIAEALEDGMEPYLGLHYPASDIPAQARALYLKNQVRLLQDVNASPAPLVPRMHPQTDSPLDLSRSVLRAMSPVHVQYLKNMGVGASLSISLVVEDRLWGLIACHHRSARFVSYATRATASLYATVLAAQLQVKQRNFDNLQVASARGAAISILTGLRDYSEPQGSLPAMLPRLMELFEATGAALLTASRSFQSGATPGEGALSALRTELGDGAESGLRISSKAGSDFPSLKTSTSNASGIVAIHLGGTEWLTLFRAEISKEIKWAGDPRLSKNSDEHGLMGPRTSFAIWLEEIRGECDPWPPHTAMLVSEVRSGILEILRHRNALLARSNEDLRRFAGVVAHEVKNHLQTGILALSMLEGRVGEEDPSARNLVSMGRDQLLELSKFTNDMLSFAQTNTNVLAEEVDLARLASEVIAELEVTGARAGASIHLTALPVILAPLTQIRHLLSNLVRNALIHGRCGSRHLNIEIGFREDHDGTVVFVRDDGCGIPVAQRQRIFEYFYRGNSSGISGTGIGLAFCAQVVHRLGHRLWVEDTAPSGGSTFCFTVTRSGESPGHRAFE